MRSVRLILYAVVGLLLGCVTVLAHAEGSVGSPAYQFVPVRWFAPQQTAANAVESPAAACISRYGSNATVKTMTDSYRCAINNFDQGDLMPSCISGYNQIGTFPYQCRSNAQACPTGSTLTSGQCVCNSGLSPHNGQCIAPQCTSKAVASSGFYDMGTSPGGSFPSVVCAGSCLAVFDGTAPASSGLQNGIRRYYAQGAFTFMGNGNSDICSGSDMPSSTAAKPDDTCPAGQVKFTVNKNTGCVTASTGEVTTPPPQKTTTTTNTTNPDNSTTQTTTTTDAGTGQTTTSTTTYPPGVTPSKPVGTTVEPSDGNGDEEGDGDKDHCEDNPDRAGCKTWDELVGETPEQIAKSEESLSVAFNAANGFGSGSYACPQNPQMVIRQTGQSITAWDWQPACTFADGIKHVVLAFAFIGAALIGMGAVRD